jgi:hypothetical protein
MEDAAHVYVQFSGLELQAANGGRTTLYYCQDPAGSSKTVLADTPCTATPAAKQIDLKALSGGLSDTLLDGYTLPAGRYNWIRLMVDTAGTRDTYLVALGGSEYELDIPSSNQTGLKLNRGFDVPAGGSADFTIDFDLRKSVHEAVTGTYILRPTLRIVDNALDGDITGTVDGALVTAGCAPAVYVFAGSGTTPDDMDGNDADPVTIAIVKLDPADGVYRYKAAFLEAGDYTVAFTCGVASDRADYDDMLGFSGTRSVAVTAGGATVYDFRVTAGAMP